MEVPGVAGARCSGRNVDFLSSVTHSLEAPWSAHVAVAFDAVLETIHHPDVATGYASSIGLSVTLSLS